MCTHYLAPDEAEIEQMWHIGRHNPLRWAGDLRPRGQGPFLRLFEPGQLELVVGQWA